MSQKMSAQFVCSSSKVSNFLIKLSLWVSVVRAYFHLPNHPVNQFAFCYLLGISGRKTAELLTVGWNNFWRSVLIFIYSFLRFDLIISIKFCLWKLGCYSKNDMVQFYFARSLHVRRVFWVFSQVYQPNNSSRVKEQQNLILAKLFEMGNNFEILQKTKRKVWKSMYLIGNSKTRFFLAYSV